MIIKYFANHYSNGGAWTHRFDLYNTLEDHLIRFELYRARDVIKVVKPVLTNVQILMLKDAMKWRDDLCINEAGKSPYPNW